MAAPTIPASNTQAVQTTGGGTTPFTKLWYDFFNSLTAFVAIGTGGSGTGGVASASGSFTAAAANETVVAQTAVTASSKIILQATNADAATLTGSVKSFYVKTKTPGVGFSVDTGNAAAAAGTETFDYVVF